MNNIKQEFDQCISEVGSYMKQMNWEKPEVYAQWLAQTYFFVKHSTRLLGLAASRVPFGHEPLLLRMAKHMSEEFGHDKIALQDLKRLNRNINEFEEAEETKCFYRNQYYGIENFGAYYLSGYILLLEGVAAIVCPTIYQRVREKFGEEATRFLKVHVEEDQDHVKKAFDQIVHLNFTEIEAVKESMKISANLYYQILNRAEKRSHGSVKSENKELNLAV